MPGKGALGSLAFVLVAALILGAMPADAKKKKRKKPAPAPVVVVTGTATSTAQNQHPTAIATCPGNLIAMGGGYSAEITSEGATFDFYFVDESRRASANSWRASGVRFDNGTSGNSLSLTATAHCLPPKVKVARKTKKAAAAKKRKRKKFKLISVTEVTSSGPFVDSPNPSSATASCPANTRLVSGGFSTSPSSTASPQVVPFVYQDYPSATGSWTAAIVNASSPTVPMNVTSYAYCATHVQLPVTVSGSSTLPPATAGPGFGSATSTACPLRTRLLGGGFNDTQPTSGGVFGLVTESLASGPSWKHSAANLSGVPGNLTVVGSCA